MKRIFLLTTFLLSFATFTFTGTAQTLDNTALRICDAPPFCQEEPICSYTDDCFRFDFYRPKDLGNGTSVLKYKIVNFSESTFQQATFELPGSSAAISPTTTFRNRYNHNVVNPYNDSLISFNARNAGTFSYGGFEVYYFVVNNAELYAPGGRKAVVTARAGRVWQQQRTGQVLVDFDLCEGPVTCPRPTATMAGPDTLCLFSDEPFIFTLNSTAGATITWTAENANITLGQGTNTVEVMADVDAGPGSISALVANECGSVIVTRTFIVLEDCAPINPLPVELLTFKGKAGSQGITLNWNTASEKNNDRFEVERSVDGKNFERIGSLQGKGTTSSASSYQFIDKAPLKGINYYRLNQVDFDGTNARSQVIKISAEQRLAGLGVQLIPNPCADQNCSEMLQGVDASKTLTVEMRDLTGRIVLSQQVPADQASFNLPQTGISKGIYILSAKNGENITTQKVIIQ